MACSALGRSQKRRGHDALWRKSTPILCEWLAWGNSHVSCAEGTHLNNTREVGSLEILSEESVSAGTRRITALTGPRAAAQRSLIENAADQACTTLGCSIDQLATSAGELMMAIRKLKKLLSSTGNDAAPEKVGGGSGKSNGTSKPADYLSKRSALRLTARAINVAWRMFQLD